MNESVMIVVSTSLLTSYNRFVLLKEISIGHIFHFTPLPPSQFSSVTQSRPTLCTPWTAACQASLSITSSQRLLWFMSVELVMTSNHLIFCYCLLLLSSLSSGSFPISQFFPSGGQSIGVSASVSVLPMNIQNWFPLGWTSLISLQSKGLSRVFSNTTVQKHQFFDAQLYL